MARNFNGTNQYLSTASSPVLNVPMTLAFWARTSASLNNAAVAVGESGSGTHRQQVQFHTGLIAAATVGSAGASFANSSVNATSNQWVHAAGVFSAADSRLIYFDGANTGSNTVSNTTNNANAIYIGARNANGVGLYFTGDIAEVGIWNAALTAAEVASLAKGMTCDKIRPQSLVFYAPLVRDLIDAKGGLTITNNNTATVATHPRVYA
jgi:hypothetical protein